MTDADPCVCIHFISFRTVSVRKLLCSRWWNKSVFLHPRYKKFFFFHIYFFKCLSLINVFLLVFNCRWASWHVHGGGAGESAEPCGPTAAGEQRQTADHVQGVDPVQVPQSAGSAARDTGLRSRTETRQSDPDRDPVWPELHPQPKLAAHPQAVLVLVLVLAFGTEQLYQDSDEEDARTLLCATKTAFHCLICHIF